MYNYNATCIRVVDGDTIDAEIDLGFDIKVTKRIRLGGINAPESRTRNKVEKKLGLAAKERLKEMMEGAANCFELESQEIGKFGRVIGEVWINDVNVNEDMIKSHHAVPYSAQNKKEVEKLHLKNRQALIDKGLYEPKEIL